jgi:hypothetical protein
MKFKLLCKKKEGVGLSQWVTVKSQESQFDIRQRTASSAARPISNSMGTAVFP